MLGLGRLFQKADSGLQALIAAAAGADRVISVREAMSISAVSCGVRVIAEGVSQISLRVLVEEQSGGRIMRRVDRDHPAYRLLAIRPNSFQTSFEFRHYMITAALLDGAFLAVKAGGGAVPSELIPIPMGAWTINRRPGTTDHYFKVTLPNNQSVDFEPQDCLYVPWVSLDGWQTSKPLQLARRALGLSINIERQQSQFASKGGTPSGILTFEQAQKPETMERLKEAWADRYGPNGDGGIAILDRMAKFTPMTLSQVDSQTIETRRFQIEEVARLLRVPQLMLMSSDKASTFASAEQHFRHLVTHTLGPWIKRIEERLERDVLGNQPGVSIDLDERGLMRGDSAAQAAYYTKALGSGGQSAWMTVNEVREEQGLNPILEDWADTVSRGAMDRGAGAQGGQGEQDA